MKYAEMEKQLDSGRFEKRPRNTTKPAYRAPTYRREPELAETPDLLAPIQAETWLANRLKDHGCDIYAGGPYATYADRLGAAIVRNGIQCVIVGRRDGKPETYAQCFERLAGRPLPKKADVTRGTSHTQLQTSDTTT